jgi:hypothetical protein
LYASPVVKLAIIIMSTRQCIVVFIWIVLNNAIGNETSPEDEAANFAKIYKEIDTDGNRRITYHEVRLLMNTKISILALFLTRSSL